MSWIHLHCQRSSYASVIEFKIDSTFIAGLFKYIVKVVIVLSQNVPRLSKNATVVNDQSKNNHTNSISMTYFPEW